MKNRDIVVVGASVGGVPALEEVLRRLPKDLPAAVFVVLHLGRHGAGILPAILSRASALTIAEAPDGRRSARDMYMSLVRAVISS